MKTLKTLLIALAASSALTACGTMDKISQIGQAPSMTAASVPDQADALGYRQVSIPMPRPSAEIRQANSLWSADRQAFFEDQRAQQIGDIVTVMINIDDTAEMSNATTKSRTSNEDVNVNNILGFETYLDKVLPGTADPASLGDLGSTSTSNGNGTIEREEEIDMKVAAVVSDRLPNGNLVIIGRQEVRVNFEKRILEIAGIIRPEDITVGNTVSYEQIAEARVSYGGEGQISDLQQPRYGQQLYDIIMPF